MLARVASKARRLTLWPRGAVVLFGLLVLVGASVLAVAYPGPAAGVPAATAPMSTPGLRPTGGALVAVMPVVPTSTPLPSARAPAATATPPATLDPLRVGTASPTAIDKAAPTLGAFDITPLVGATMVTPNPTAVPAVRLGASVVNILLVGTDYRLTDNTYRTDTLIIASVDKNEGMVNLLSIPRDLFVYIPKWGMGRINQAYSAAGHNGYPGGGPALLEQTLLYNLGIPIHYYALVNFDGFRQIVDTLGGIDVPVNCQLTEYKLRDPALDEREAANYELYTQPVGLAHMDGALALWYARARPVGGDFFRSYRQRQVLRAIYHQGLQAHVIPRIPALYGDFTDVVQTDMSLWDVMQFVPLASKLGDAQIRSLNIGPNQTTGWVTPNGEAVLLPKPDAIQALVADFFSDTGANRLSRALTWVEISNGVGDLTNPQLAAETLMNEGFAVRYGEPQETIYSATTLVDYTTSAKASPLKKLQSLLHIADKNVIARPDAASPVQFQVILGSDYNPCPRLDWMDTSP